VKALVLFCLVACGGRTGAGRDAGVDSGKEVRIGVEHVGDAWVYSRDP
jgi:hypothetical protein